MPTDACVSVPHFGQRVAALRVGSHALRSELVAEQASLAPAEKESAAAEYQ
jgi:hypothetical protein